MRTILKTQDIQEKKWTRRLFFQNVKIALQLGSLADICTLPIDLQHNQ
jgi:hypothetical protein